MKNRFSLAAAVAVTVFLFGCSDADPVGLTPTDEAVAFSGGETQMRQVTEFTMFLQEEFVLNPVECISVDNQGTLHFRACKTTTEVTGDFVGTELTTLYLVVDADGNGHARGSFTFFPMCHVDLGCGTLEGNFAGRIVAGVLLGAHTYSRGTGGDFIGLHVQGTSTNVAGLPTPSGLRPFEVTGIVW